MYVIKQYIKNLFYSEINIKKPTNDETIEKIMNFLAGKLELCHVSENHRTKFEVIENNIDFEQIMCYEYIGFSLNTHTNISPKYRLERLWTHYTPAEARAKLNNLYIKGFIFDEPKAFEFKLNSEHKPLQLFFDNEIKLKIQSDIKKNEYIKFIVSKFREYKFKIIYFNLMQNIRKYSIDLIVYNKEKIFLVQCESEKINLYEKLTIFVRDCFIYKQRNYSKIKFKIKFVFFTSDEILSKSAQIFINQNRDILEHKVLRFE